MKTQLKKLLRGRLNRAKQTIKDSELNNLCISNSKGNSPIIPLGQEIIKNNTHILLEIGGHFSTCFIGFVNHMDKCFQASRGVSFLHQFLDQRHRGENDALTSAGDVREEAVFDGIVFGTVGGIVGNANFDPNFIGQRLQVLLEQVVTGTVAAAAITQDQNGGGVGIKLATIGVPPMAKAITREFTGVMTVAQLDVAHIELQVVEAVWDDDVLGVTVEIMVVGVQFCQSIQLSVPIEVADRHLLFGIHTDNRVASHFKFGLEPGDVLKLLIAVFDLWLQTGFLLSFAAAVVMLFEQLVDHILADGNIVLDPQQFDNLARRQVRPAHCLIHGVARSVVTQHDQKFLVQLRSPDDRVRFASAARFPNALLYFPLGQAAHFAGPFAHGVPAAAQHPGDITSSTRTKPQGFPPSEAAAIFLVQTVVKAAHRFFYFGCIGFHLDLLACVLVRPR